MSMGRATCPLFWAAALGAAQPCGVSLTARGIAPASLRYDRLTLVARVAGPLCLAGCPLLGCVPARLSPVASMAPGDVCNGPRCSLAGLRPAALGCRPCSWPPGSAGSPQCARPMGSWFFPVPRPPYACKCVWCPGTLGSCSPLCPLDALCCVCGVLGNLAHVHRCACSLRCIPCAVSWATWLLFTGVLAPCVAFRVRCPGPLGSCSPMCTLGLLCLMFGVVGHLAPVPRCARSVGCVACAVSWATWLLFTGVPAACVVWRVRCPGPLGSCSPLCPLRVLCCACGVLAHLAPVHRCARSVRCVACAVSWATWLLFTGVPALCVVTFQKHLRPTYTLGFETRQSWRSVYVVRWTDDGTFWIILVIMSIIPIMVIM